MRDANLSEPTLTDHERANTFERIPSLTTQRAVNDDVQPMDLPVFVSTGALLSSPLVIESELPPMTDHKVNSNYGVRISADSKDKPRFESEAEQFKLKREEAIRLINSVGEDREIGPAYELLKNNRFGAEIRALIKREANKRHQPENQLKYAVLGGALQCENCFKFVKNRYKLQDHSTKCRAGLVYRVTFARLMGKFFCYYGCNTFHEKNTLVRHLIYEHSSDLWRWGLSVQLLWHSIKGKTSTQIAFRSDNADNIAHGSEDVGVQKTMTQNTHDNVPHESFLETLLNEIASKDDTKFCHDLIFTDETVMMHDWLIYRHNHALLVKNHFKLQVLLQSNHFIGIQRLPCPQCMPPAPRVEISSGSTVCIGFGIGVCSTVELLKAKRDWVSVRRCIELAAFELLELHEKHGIVNGGISLDSLVYQGHRDRVYFTQWGHACTRLGIAGRIASKRQYYFKSKHGSSFEDLKKDDLLALLLVYSDCAAAMNGVTESPSTLLQLEYSSLRPLRWNMWLDQVSLTGIRPIDDLLAYMAKSVEHRYDELVGKAMLIFTNKCWNRSALLISGRSNPENATSQKHQSTHEPPLSPQMSP